MAINPYEYLTCELMECLNEKVIFCCSGEWNSLYYIVFETNSFTPISNYSGIIDNNVGGQLFISSVNSTIRENIVCALNKIKT